jgi:hypothetical protein
VPEINFVDIRHKWIISLKLGYVVLVCIILEPIMMLVRNVVSVCDFTKELLMEIHGKVSISGGTLLLWRTFLNVSRCYGLKTRGWLLSGVR